MNFSNQKNQNNCEWNIQIIQINSQIIYQNKLFLIIDLIKNIDKILEVKFIIIIFIIMETKSGNSAVIHIFPTQSNNIKWLDWNTALDTNTQEFKSDLNAIMNMEIDKAFRVIENGITLELPAIISISINEHKNSWLTLESYALQLFLKQNNLDESNIYELELIWSVNKDGDIIETPTHLRNKH